MMDYLTQIFQVFSLLVYWGFSISVVFLAIFGGKIEIEVNGLAQIIKILQKKEGSRDGNALD